MEECDLYWLVGLLEGEGTFVRSSPSTPNAPRVRLSMTDEDIVHRAAVLMNTIVYADHSERYRLNGWKQPFMCTVSGAKAVRLMKEIYPFMGERRQKQIDQAIATYFPRERKISESDARKLAQRYHAGDRHPTALGKEFGIGKNLAIYFINKYMPA